MNASHVRLHARMFFFVKIPLACLSNICLFFILRGREGEGCRAQIHGDEEMKNGV